MSDLKKKFEKFFTMKDRLKVVQRQMADLGGEGGSDGNEEADRLYGELEYEEDALIQDIRFEIAQAYPTPSCCKKIQDYPVIFFEPPHWSANVPSFFSKHKKAAWWDKMPHPKYCCFCGKKLPEMVKNKDLEVASNDDDYCGTCGERNRNCLCLPPSAAYEEKQ
jgi:hypothetical protein